MSKLRAVYIISLVILAVLIALTIFKPMKRDAEYSEVARGGLLETADGWVIEYDIFNHEGRDQIYIITVVIDGTPYCQDVLIRNGREFTYTHRITRDNLTQGVVTCTICKEGEETLFEQATYCLK